MADHEDGAHRRPNRARNGLEINPRDRLFHAVFIKVAAIYMKLAPKWFRTLFELMVLGKALILFVTLSYIHFTFSKNPMDCLGKIKDDWPRDGILQIQLVKKQQIPIQTLKTGHFASERNYSLVQKSSINSIHNQCPINGEFSNVSYNAAEVDYDSSWTWIDSNRTADDSFPQETNAKNIAVNKDNIESSSFDYPADFPSMSQLFKFYGQKPAQDYYIMEYTLEYGFLRLSKETRERLKIPIKIVNLDPNKDKCFGDSLSRFILDKFLGYDDILMGSIKRLAEKQNNQGYMRNVLTGENYKFVTTWMGRTSYLVAFFLMFIFTVSISTLLRFCHQQIFIFIVHLLQVMDWNVSYAFPIAPLFTVILSLVGMEAIMAEFFNDTTTSFYVILMVWAADQFDHICCHTKLSQKFWPRFFFLYHFVFYAYHYRFNGQYSSIALASSWFFIQHSMLYFLHNYEIPAIQHELNNRGENGENAGDIYFDDAFDLLMEEIDLSARVDQPANNLEPQQQQNEVVNDGINGPNDSQNPPTAGLPEDDVTTGDIGATGDIGTQQNGEISEVSGAQESEVTNEWNGMEARLNGNEAKRDVMTDIGSGIEQNGMLGNAFVSQQTIENGCQLNGGSEMSELEESEEKLTTVTNQRELYHPPGCGIGCASEEGNNIELDENMYSASASDVLKTRTNERGLQGDSVASSGVDCELRNCSFTS